MKFFFAILCLIGLSASSSLNQLKWEPGQKYTFNYQGRLLTGLPELANHFSGLGIRCQVDLTVGAESTPEVQEFGIRIQNPQYSRVNQVLKSAENEQSENDQGRNNWRNLLLPEFAPAPEESRRHLETPAVFKLNPRGGFVSIVISENEPEWSVNFKKALVTLFQTQFQSGYPTQENLSDAVNRIDADQQRDNDNEGGVTYWRTQEESLDGICDVSYQINELPAYMIREKPETVSYPRSCQNQNGNDGQYFEIVKTRDVSSCSKRTSFSYYKPGFFQCSTGNCEGMWSRSSITRYVACRGQGGQLNIQSIVNEAELQQNLFGFNTEKFLTGNKQNLTLVHQQESSSGSGGRLPYPNNQIELKSLYYEYKLKSGSGEQLVDQNQLEENTAAYKSLPRHISLTGTYTKEEREKINPSKLVPQVQKLFKQIVNEDLFNIVDIPQKQITFKGLSIARAFSILPRSEIENIYNTMKNEFNDQEKKEMFRNIFVDTLTMGGSVSNIQFVKELILKDELTTMQVISFFTFMPHYVVAPTEPLLQSLYELTTSEYIRQKPFLYNHAIMSYSQLIQKACLAENRMTSYPTYVFGSFCNPDSHVVLNKWIPFLQKELHNSGTSEHRNTIIVSLGLLSHKNIISVLVPYIEQVNPNSQEYSRLTRFLAVYSLGNVGRQYPQIVAPMLYAVYSNPAEATDVRIAAFNVIIRLNPSMAVFHRIASSTWWERDNEVLQVVNTALYSLGQQRVQQVQGVQDIYTTLQHKAYLVYPLIRQTAGTFPTSGVLYSNEYMSRLGVGYRGIQSWIDSKDSLIPSDIYGRLVYYLDQYQFAPVEAALRIRGGWNLAQQILEIINPELKKESSEEQQYEKVKHQLNKEWRQVVEKLQLKARDSGLAEGALYLNLFEDSPIFHSFQSSSSEMLKEKIMPLLTNPQKIKKLLGGEQTRINFQRMINLAPSEFMIPSDMGFPILVEVHMPVTLSVHGHITANAENGVLPSFKMNVKTLYASQMTGYVGTICPFTEEFVTTGIDEHSVINLPAEISVNLNVPEHKMNVRLHALNVNQPIDIFHFHVRPYTVHQKMYDLTPMTLSNNVKFIESQESPKRREFRFGESLGLDLKTVLTTESPFVDLRAAVQKLQMFNYNPLNLLRFQWVSTAQTQYGLPSFRKHEIQVKYNPGQSTTKEVEIQVQLGVGTKQDQKPFKYHTIKAVNPQESSSSRRNILPYQLVSKPIGEQQEQQSLQQKMKSMVEQTQVSEGQAISVQVTTVLKGSGRAAGSSSYSLNYVSGRQGFQQKWNMNLENHNSNQKFCLNGKLNVPQIPVWSIEELRNNQLEFTYQNEIGFGRDCQESRVVIRGGTRSNQQQKEFSKKSQEAKKWEQMKRQGAQTPELSQAAEQVRRQASILNEVDFTVQYENVPAQYLRYCDYLREALKASLWPYVSNNESNNDSEYYQRSESNQGESQFNQGESQFNQRGSQSNQRGSQSYNGVNQENQGENQSNNGGVSDNSQIKYRLVFAQNAQTFDLYMTTPRENIRFMHVRIGAPFNYLFPVPANRNSLMDLTKNIVGKSAYPTCQVNGRWIQTYDNATSALPLEDDCWHLLSGDCSPQKRFGVLVRAQSGQGENRKETKIFIGQTSIKLIPESQTRMKVIVNGTKEIDTNSKRGHFVDIIDENNQRIAKVMQSIDGVLVLKSGPVNVLTNGAKINVEASWLYKNQLCGLCGDLNDNKMADLRGPNQCVYSKPELLVASYRVSLNDKPCKPLPRQVEEQLQAETERCAKYEVIPSKVAKSFQAHTGRCSTHQHQIVYRSSDICFSQIPIQECGMQCKPQSIVEKTIPFACLPKGKLSELYVQKARSGEVIQELQNLPKTYKAKLHLPKTCEQVQRNF